MLRQGGSRISTQGQATQRLSALSLKSLSIVMIFNVAILWSVSCFPNHFHSETNPETVSLSRTITSSLSSSTASHLRINPEQAHGLPSASQLRLSTV